MAGFLMRSRWAMLVGPVTAVDYRRIENGGKHMGSSRHTVADHDRIGPHGLEVACRVLQRLTFGRAARA